MTLSTDLCPYCTRWVMLEIRPGVMECANCHHQVVEVQAPLTQAELHRMNVAARYRQPKPGEPTIDLITRRIPQ